MVISRGINVVILLYLGKQILNKLHTATKEFQRSKNLLDSIVGGLPSILILNNMLKHKYISLNQNEPTKPGQTWTTITVPWR